MIELSPSMAINLYLGLTLFILLGIWIYNHYTSVNQKVIANDNELLVCEFCHYAYLEEIGKKVNKCPQCNSFNKNNRFQK